MSEYTPIYLTALGYRCELVFDRYADNGRLAMRLIAPPDSEMPGEPIATCTVNIPEVRLGPNEVLIKDWSENQGMLNDLAAAGIIGCPVASARVGRVVAYICPLLVEPQL